MKEVKATLQPFEVDAVTDALQGVPGVEGAPEARLRRTVRDRLGLFGQRGR